MRHSRDCNIKRIEVETFTITRRKQIMKVKSEGWHMEQVEGLVHLRNLRYDRR